MFAEIEDRNEEGEPCLMTPPQGGRPPFEAWYKTVGFSDLAPATLERIIEDCEQFVAYSRDVCKVDGYEQSPSDGRWFWDSRQREEWKDKNFPPLTITLGFDGLIYFKEV